MFFGFCHFLFSLWVTQGMHCKSSSCLHLCQWTLESSLSVHLFVTFKWWSLFFKMFKFLPACSLLQHQSLIDWWQPTMPHSLHLTIWKAKAVHLIRELNWLIGYSRKTFVSTTNILIWKNIFREGQVRQPSQHTVCATNTISVWFQSFLLWNAVFRAFPVQLQSRQWEVKGQRWGLSHSVCANKVMLSYILDI